MPERNHPFTDSHKRTSTGHARQVRAATARSAGIVRSTASIQRPYASTSSASPSAQLVVLWHLYMHPPFCPRRVEGRFFELVAFPHFLTKWVRFAAGVCTGPTPSVRPRQTAMPSADNPDSPVPCQRRKRPAHMAPRIHTGLHGSNGTRRTDAMYLGCAGLRLSPSSSLPTSPAPPVVSAPALPYVCRSVGIRRSSPLTVAVRRPRPVRDAANTARHFTVPGTAAHRGPSSRRDDGCTYACDGYCTRLFATCVPVGRYCPLTGTVFPGFLSSLHWADVVRSTRFTCIDRNPGIRAGRSGGRASARAGEHQLQAGPLKCGCSYSAPAARKSPSARSSYAKVASHSRTSCDILAHLSWKVYAWRNTCRKAR